MIGTFVSFSTIVVTLVTVLIEGTRRLLTPKSSSQVDPKVLLGFGVVLSLFHLSCLVLYYMGLELPAHSHGHSPEEGCQHHGHSHSHGHEHHSSDNVFSAILHVMVDFFHSFLVVFSAGVVFLVGKQHSATIDAVSSLFLSVVIGSGCYVLLQTLCTQFKTYNRYKQVEQPIT